MGRLPDIDASDAPDDVRRVFETLERERGFVPNLYRAAANAPHFLSAFAEMVATSRTDSALPGRLKELAVLQIAKLTGARTMWDSHLSLARAAGLSETTIDRLPEWQTGIGLPEERAVLAVVDEATQSVRVSDDAWTAAATQLDREQLAELVFVVAFYNMVARILEPLKVEPDPRYGNAG